jgi:hypothetical protein
MRASGIEICLPKKIGRYPIGGNTLIAGPSGVGKSTFVACEAAKLTTGEATGKPEPVIMIMREDNDKSITVPRFIAAGGDLALLTIPPPERRLWKFPRDMGELRGLYEGSGARIAFMDPLQTFVSSLVQQKGMERLEELHAMADEMEVANVFVHHFTKHITKVKTVKDAIAGGHGVYDNARSILVYSHEPGAAPAGRFVLAHEKISGEALSPAELYERRIVPHLAEPTNDDYSLALVDLLDDEVEYTALQVALNLAPGDTPADRAEAIRSAILSALAEGALSAEELEAEREEWGYTDKSWKEQRANLKKEGLIEQYQEKGADGMTTEHRWRKVRTPEEDAARRAEALRKKAASTDSEHEAAACNAKAAQLEAAAA